MATRYAARALRRSAGGEVGVASRDTVLNLTVAAPDNGCAGLLARPMTMSSHKSISGSLLLSGTWPTGTLAC